MEIKEKLEANNNFHLCFKTILISDNDISNELSLHINNSYVLDNSKDYFEQLEYCKKNNVEYIFYDGVFPYFIPLFVVITNGDASLVYPFVKTIYSCKDNRIENKIIDSCRNYESTFVRIKQKELVESIIGEINKYYEM